MGKEKERKLYKKLRDNPWISATIILGVLVLILFWSVPFNQTGNGSNVISKSEAKEKLSNFVDSQLPEGQETEIKNITKESGLYKATISFQGQESPIYITLDGENLVQGVMSFEEIKQMQEAQAQAQQAEVQEPAQNISQ